MLALRVGGAPSLASALLNVSGKALPGGKNSLGKENTASWLLKCNASSPPFSSRIRAASRSLVLDH